MNGPQHFVAAEAALAEAAQANFDSSLELSALAAAQVHATLALAAATALSTGNYAPKDTAAAWLDVAS